MPEPGTGELITNAAPGIVGSHDIILQSLDSWRPYLKPDGTYETVFYGSDVFEGTENQWQTVPVILGQRHPDTPYSANPVKALEEAGGVVVGNLADVSITKTGTPAMRSTLVLNDKTAESEIKSRKMALSSGFLSRKEDGKLTGISGKVVPDHVLLFRHDKDRRPQDQGCLILNSTEEGTMPEDESIKKVLSDFLAELKSLIVPAKADPVMPVVPETKGLVLNMTETKIAELEKTVSDQAELIKNMTAELDGFKQAEEQRKAAELENKWSLVKNSIAPGLTATAELETAARSEWQADPTSFLIKNAVGKAPETKPDGIQFVKNASSDEDAEYLKFLRGEV